MTSATASRLRPANTHKITSMFDHWKSQPLKIALQLLIMGLVILGSFVEKGIGATALTMALLSIAVLLFKSGQTTAKHPLNRVQYAMMLCLAGPGLTSIIAFGLADPHYWTSARLDLPSRYLLILPVFLVLCRYTFSVAWLWMTIALGCLCAGGTAVYLSIFKGNLYVAGGLGHHILFGNISALLTASLLALTYFLYHQNRWILAIGILGSLSGATAVLLAGARGAWLTLLVLIIMLPLLLAPRRAWLKSLIIFCVCSGCAVALYHAPNLKVKYRVDAAVQDIHNLNAHFGARTSVGARLEMWQTAGIIFSNNILFGTGPRTFQEEGRALVTAGAVRDYGQHFKHAHNQVLNTLATTGIFGLLALIALHACPIVFAWPHLKYNPRQASAAFRSNDERNSITRQSTCGFAAVAIIFSIGFIVAGLTEAILDRHSATMFYLVVTSLCLSQVINKQKPLQPATT